MKAATATSRKRSNAGRSPGVGEQVLALTKIFAGFPSRQAAAKVEELADTVSRFSDEFENLPHLQAYADFAAGNLYRAADYVMENDLPAMAGDVREFSRRHPFALMAGGVAAGLALSQMARTRRTAHLTKAASPKKAASRKKKSGVTP
jgi:hypothetical protein